ncbi:hypothetical protein Slin14017_G068410 [Septoria linicola]|nr:hypothetical protein Slin14017_G068410 [Septoria linicola]
MPRSKALKPASPSPDSTSKDIADVFPTPSLNDQHICMSYEIARGEQGVLTFEPYKSILLPHWRFRTVPIAEESSKTLKGAFDHYVGKGDFVGSDMARKFIQMGMTRAKRYANHAGGKKYAQSSLELEREHAARTGSTSITHPNHSKLKRTELPKSTDHAGQEEKLAASEIFKVLWRQCTSDAGYLKLKEEWQKEKKAWLKAGGKKRETRKGKGKGGVKQEDEDEEDGDEGGVEVKKEADTGVRIKKEESGDQEEE